MAHPDSRPSRLRRGAVVAALTVLTVSALAAAAAAVPSNRATPQGHGLTSVASQPDTPPRKGPDYLGLDAISASDVWAVGELRHPRHTNLPIADHWDGSAWTATQPVVPAGADAWLTSVDSDSSSDVWAVGDSNDGSGVGNQPLIERWNGTAWTQMHVRHTSFAAADLVGVAVIAPDDVWVVGYGVNGGYSLGAYAQHWNGKTWRTSAIAGGNGSQALQVRGITATSPTDVWVTVGQDVVDHLSGDSSWNPISTQTEGYLDGVSADSANDAWAVGFALVDEVLAPVVQHWDGTAWTTSPIAGPQPGRPCSLTGVSAVAPDDVWAVGVTDYKHHYRKFGLNVIEHYDGTSWRVVPNPVGLDAGGQVAVSADGADDAWAVTKAAASTVERWNGTVWSIDTP